MDYPIIVLCMWHQLSELSWWIIILTWTFVCDVRYRQEITRTKGEREKRLWILFNQPFQNISGWKVGNKCTFVKVLWYFGTTILFWLSSTLLSSQSEIPEKETELLVVGHFLHYTGKIDLQNEKKKLYGTVCVFGPSSHLNSTSTSITKNWSIQWTI